MIVYMVHPQHGVHIAYDPLEVERCKANGWSIRDDKKPEPVPEDQAPKKRGRPKKD